MCLDAETQRAVQVVSPIHPDTHEAEIANLKHGSYLVFLEVHVSISPREASNISDGISWKNKEKLCDKRTRKLKNETRTARIKILCVCRVLLVSRSAHANFLLFRSMGAMMSSSLRL